MAEPSGSPTQMQAVAAQMALLKGPAAKPPVGVTPDLLNPSNNNTLIIATVTLCLVFAALAFLIRMYTKLFLIRSTEYEDCRSL